MAELSEADFQIKQGNTLPVLTVRLVDANGEVDLTNAQEVTFVMSKDFDIPFGGEAIIRDAVHGEVEYQWQESDTSVRGKYRAEWVVTWGTGDTTTFPSPGYRTIEVGRSL